MIKYKDNGDSISGYIENRKIIIVGYDRLRISMSSYLPTDIKLAKMYIKVMQEAIKQAEEKA